MNHQRGTVSTPTGSTDLCPPCGVQRRVDGYGRFQEHPAVHPDPDGDPSCWASGRTRADVENAEALGAGAAYDSLEGE
jgi:hypothetical protein